MDICRPLLNQKHSMEWFLLQRFVDLVRIYFLLIVSRNHSSRVNIVLISGFRQIYAGSFKDKGHLFTLNLRWQLKFVEYLFLKIFFISLHKSVSLHRRCCLMSKFPEILILLCRKIFSVFYLIFQETFSNSCSFALI